MGLFIYYRKHSALIACWKALTPTSLSFASLHRKAGAQCGRRWANPLLTSILGCWGGMKLAHRDQSATGEALWLVDSPQLSSLVWQYIRRPDQGDDISISHRPLISMGLLIHVYSHATELLCLWLLFLRSLFLSLFTAGNYQSLFHEGWHSGKITELQSWGPPSPTAALFGRLDAGCVLLLLSHSWRRCSINWGNEVHLHL